jgi:Tfp pilus assembly protein PilV
MKTQSRKTAQGFTLEEVVISVALAALCLSGIIAGYRLSLQRSEWCALSLAAQAAAQARMEQTRSAKWDPLAYPPVDQIVETNFPVITRALDSAIVGTNVTTATVRTSISLLSTNPPLKNIQVECRWLVRDRDPFTNTLTTWRSPDQ